MAFTEISMIEGELNLSTGSINSTTNPSETQVYDWIDQAQDIISRKTGINYGKTLNSNKIFDWENNDGILYLEPFTSITALYYNVSSDETSPSWVEKTEDIHFITYPSYGHVEFLKSQFNPSGGKRKFKITYTTGVTKVPQIIKAIASKIVANNIVSATINNQVYEGSGGSVKVGIISINDPSSFSISAFRSRQQEINDFFKNYIGTIKAHRIDREYF